MQEIAVLYKTESYTILLKFFAVIKIQPQIISHDH